MNLPRPALLFFLVLLASPCCVALGAEPATPALQGYCDDDAIRDRLRALERADRVGLVSLTATRTGRQVWLLKIGRGAMDQKPAILIVGGVAPEHLLGTELVLGLAERLADRDNRAVDDMLERVTFYLVPRASPELYENFFRRPYCQRQGNARPVDDDHDGQADEDGPDDLNGDGVVTIMRVEDPSGTMMEHPKDPRLLIEARRSADEKGRWKLYAEGRDDDHDEQYNEDPAGGVNFNRNFPFRYPYFGAGAGLYAVSEPESKALADFAYDHPNIALVLTFGPDDNLMQPWKAEPAGDGERKKNESGPKPGGLPSGPSASVAQSDAALLAHMAEIYQKIHGGKNPPAVGPGQGSFAQWAYFHYGRWSLAARAWWIPSAEKESPDNAAPEAGAAKSKPAEAFGKEPKAADRREDLLGTNPSRPGHSERSEESRGKEILRFAQDDGNRPSVTDTKADPKKAADAKRGADELNALRWFAQQKIDGFVAWRPIENPDFPGRKVEVGGFRPFVRTNPPAGQIPGLVEKHWTFLTRLTELLPRVEICRTKVEPLGKGVCRVTAEVLNRGYLPTMSKAGASARQAHPLQIELRLPRQISLVTGTPRSELPVLDGNGGKAEYSWLVSSVPPKPVRVQVRVWSPSVGEAQASIELAAPDQRPEAKASKEQKR